MSQQLWRARESLLRKFSREEKAANASECDTGWILLSSHGNSDRTGKMFLNNSSSFTIVEVSSELPVILRVVLVVSACVASTLGNVVILITFILSVQRKENNRCRVVDIIIASLAIAALCRGLALGPIRAICFIKGEWSLGDSMCQLQAYFEAMLRNLIAWNLSLLSIERYTKHMIPHEYLVTFSPLTVNIILPGILLIVIVQVTGPLYGWGKYEYIQEIGLCGAATMSTFGCSYALYLLFSLTLPPFTVILINSILISYLVCNKTKGIIKNLSCGNSRILSAENEVISLLVFIVLFIILSIPRCVADVTLACSGINSLLPTAVFSIYYIESLTDLLLPLLCLGMHSKSRKMLFEAFRKGEKSICDKQIASSN